MSSTLEDLAVVGRRIAFTYYRDLPDGPAHPGIITGRFPSQGASVNVELRLDGMRHSLHIPPNYQGLRYLDEVVPVPALPMGRFHPFRSDSNGFWEKEGVLLAAVGEDGEDLVVITDDRDQAIAAARAYLQEVDVDLDYVDLDDIRAHWAVFEWEPEDAESPWSVRWDAEEGDDMAIRIHYLPA